MGLTTNKFMHCILVLLHPHNATMPQVEPRWGKWDDFPLCESSITDCVDLSVSCSNHFCVLVVFYAGRY